MGILAELFRYITNNISNFTTICGNVSDFGHIDSYLLFTS